jgi:PAS domain S-box-containing protein
MKAFHMKAKATYNELEKKISLLEEQIEKCRYDEKTLIANEERFRLAFENANIGMCMVDTDGRLVYVNKKFNEILGYEKSDIIGRSVNDVTHPEDLKISPTVIRDAVSGKITHAEFEKRYIHKDGHILWGVVTASLVRDDKDAPMYFISQLKDITEQKKSEHELLQYRNELEHIISERTFELVEVNKQLKQEIEEHKMAREAVRKSEERYAFAVAGSTDGLWDWEILSDSVYYSDRFKELLGYSGQEFPGTVDAFRSHLHPEDADEVWAAVQRHLNERIPYNIEYRMKMKSNSYKWFLARGQAIWDNEGRAIRLSGSIHDITERKLAEKARRESEMKFRIVADNTYDWEWWRDASGNFKYISPSCKRITQIDREEFIKDPDFIWNIIHPDDMSSFFSHIINIEQKDFSGEIEFRIVRPDGSIRWIAHACQPAYDENGQFVGRRGSNRDITDRKKAEQALLESERQLRHLSAQLLAAQETERRRISRELHDQLGGDLSLLKLRCSVMEKKLGNETPLHKECKENLQYIDHIIENVRRLSRDLSPSIIEDLSFTRAIQWLINNFVKHYDIAVKPDIRDEIDPLLSKNDKIMVYRIFQEALTNIRKHAQATMVKIKARKKKEGLFFVIEDNGKGFNMEPDSLKNGFDKGLGLATMDERSRILNGSLKLWSKEGKGTRVSLNIPLSIGETGK